MKSHAASIRLSPRDDQELSAFGAIEGLSRAGMLRRLLHLGLEVYREAAAVQGYAARKMSLGRAAKLAGVSQWEMLGLLEKHHVELLYGASDLANDLRAIPKGK
jgi:predicted HTH domain antitoxin